MRRAYVCKKCEPAYRVFLLRDEKVPNCPKHGKTMVEQKNVPYVSQKVKR